MIKVPNDLSEEGVVYFREYVTAGGSEHAAKAYAMACCQRDMYASRLEAITAGNRPSEDDKQGQIMWAVQKSWVAASATAEKLRDALPAEPPKPADDTGFFE